MLKIFLLLLISVTYANASFWGSLFGSALGGGGSSVVVNEKEALELKNNKKVQQALRAMKYYQSQDIDGNLNTFDSRNAIENFQIELGYDEKATPSYIQTLLGTGNKESFHPGILDKYTKENLIYQFELTNEFSNILYRYEPTIITTLENLLKREEQLYQATLINEKRLSKNSKTNTLISSHMSKVIKEDKEDLQTLKKNLKETLQSKKNVAIDTEQKLLWQDQPIKLMTQNKAKEYCQKLTLNGLPYWRLPTMKEYQTLKNPMKVFKYTPKPNRYNEVHLWTSKDSYVYDIQNRDDDYARSHYDMAVKCVHAYE